MKTRFTSAATANRIHVIDLYRGKIIHFHFFLKGIPCLDWTQFQSICRLQINVAKIMISSRLENIVGKGKNEMFKLFLFCRLQMISIWTCPKFCDFVKS